MKILIIPEVLNKAISALCTAIIPALINYYAITWWYSDENRRSYEFDTFVARIAFWTAVASIICWCVIYRLLPHFRCFREFSRYEGRWLQIIPDCEERPYSVIDFDYNKELRKYELKGINFCKDTSEGGISFNAYRFVERTFHDGFYYITNQTTENKNGLGKLGFIRSNYDNLTRAEGYFFDSSNENQSKKYNTILVKCDRTFFEHLGWQHQYLNFKKVPPIEIIRLSQEFIENEIKCYARKQQRKP